MSTGVKRSLHKPDYLKLTIMQFSVGLRRVHNNPCGKKLKKGLMRVFLCNSIGCYAE